MHEERIFVRDGRRHYRRRYSTREAAAGLVIVAVLAAVAAWVAWRGARPDPELFTALPLNPSVAAAPADRGPLPQGIAPPGFREAGLAAFPPDDLYVKIDGRADYYRGFGCRHLHVLTLASEATPGRLIDIELFDQGNAGNALATYQGERLPAAKPVLGASGLHHFDRNALFLTWGRHYVRAIASDESDESRAALVALRASLEAGLPPEPLPWTYSLFAQGLGLDPDAVSYHPENAFSLGFARDVHVALLGDGDTEVFVVASDGAAAAADLARRFGDAFLSLGESAGEKAGVAWARDRYLGTMAGARASGDWVVGVRGARDIAAAVAALGRLEQAVAALPEVASVVPASTPGPKPDRGTAPAAEAYPEGGVPYAGTGYPEGSGDAGGEGR